MSKPSTVEQVLDFAIGREQDAADFYAGLARRASVPAMRTALEEFSREEAAHKASLERLKARGGLKPDAKRVAADLKIADYLVEVQASPEMSFQDALVVAMKREKASYGLYSQLAAASSDESVRETFRALAREEAAHKLRFETEYDESVLKDN